jgi:hypothetical protein
MAIYTTQYNFNWKPVKGNYTKPKQLCPRCNNEVQYSLVWDGEGIGFGGFNLINTRKAYAFKCPICPNYDAVTNEVAKAILKG